MPAKAFFDSNVFLYSFATDELGKQTRARQLIGSSIVVVSCQVLQECANVLRKRMGHSPDRAAERIRPLLGYEVVPISTDLVERSWALATRYGLSTYDGAIVAAAQLARCGIVYSEEMQNGQIYDGVKVVNPFL